MSIEQKLENLTAAIFDLTAVIQSMAQPPAGASPSAKPSPAKGKPRAAAASKQQEPAVPGEEPAAPETDKEREARFEEVRKAVLQACQDIGRDGVTVLLDQFGAAKASQVDESQWQELLDAIKSATDAKVAA
jgi:hypothetical protein